MRSILLPPHPAKHLRPQSAGVWHYAGRWREVVFDPLIALEWKHSLCFMRGGRGAEPRQDLNPHVSVSKVCPFLLENFLVLIGNLSHPWLLCLCLQRVSPLSPAFHPPIHPFYPSMLQQKLTELLSIAKTLELNKEQNKINQRVLPWAGEIAQPLQAKAHNQKDKTSSLQRFYILQLQ